jgi:NADPH2:quinone reductase
MKAMVTTLFCGPDDLKLIDLPDPVAGPGEAVIAIKAAALNFFDLLIIAGKYQRKPPFPFSPAAEFAGVVESVGAGVTEVKPGDRVAAEHRPGCAREKLVISADKLIKIPERLEFERAAGLIVTYGTTLYALEDRGQLKPGETLAVLGAAGGAGLAACELGKLMGARVIACASSPEKLAFAKQHGADEVIDYAKEDLKEALLRVTGGKGADVIYDPVGGPYSERALRAIGRQGRLLVIGFAAGDIPKISFNLFLLKNCDVRGVAWTEREPRRPNVEKLMSWAAEGKISVHVHATYPLAKTADALKVLATRKAIGKVILTI